MTERTVQTLYWLGDIVYLRVALERQPGMVTSVNLRPGGGHSYDVQWSTGAGTYFEMELTSEFVATFD